MIKNAQMTVISPERYNWVSDVLRLDGGEVQDRADHRYRHQCMRPGGHPECPYIGGNARFAIICVIAPTFLPTYLVPTYLPTNQVWSRYTELYKKLTRQIWNIFKFVSKLLDFTVPMV